jgi:hypothetical protein
MDGGRGFGACMACGGVMFSHVQTIFLVAGGPSLRGFDWGWLKGQAVVAINRAHEVVPNARVLWWSDWRFWEQHEDALRLHRAPIKASFKDRHRRAYPEWVAQYQHNGVNGLELKRGWLRHGNNGGHAALNLAIQLGARRIVLLGYDMELAADGADHWHEPHPWGQMRERTLDKMMKPHFEGIAQDAEELGVEILNANRGSALRSFRFTDEVPYARQHRDREESRRAAAGGEAPAA